MPRNRPKRRRPDMIKALLTAALLALSLSMTAKAAPINDMEAEAWRLACVYKGVNCSHLKVPQVWYLEMPDEDTLGFYKFGSDAVILNIKLYGNVAAKY